VTSVFYVNLVDFNEKIEFLHQILRYLFPPVFIPVLSSRLGGRRSVLPFSLKALVARSCGSSISLIDLAAGSLP
jgi:hypothetical protein